jgi:hypothetical protein
MVLTAYFVPPFDRSQAPKNLPCHHLARPTLPRPPHPVPNVRDDRDTPLSRAGTARLVVLIWVDREQENFYK